ncbi:hypothetical protein ACVRZD_05585 [Streptococcus hongkongensis]
MTKKFDNVIQYIPKFPRWVWLISYILLVGMLSEIIPAIPLFVTAIGLGISFRHITKTQKRIEGQRLAKRIQDLKNTIHLADKQTLLLNDYLAINDYSHYKLTANQLLARIDYIKEESLQLKPQITKEVYHRINQKADAVKVDIVLQLEKLEQISGPSPENPDLHLRILQQAPELQELYQSIQTDHQTILKKIKCASNVAELEAIHDSNMRKFYDILDGYLKIKASPKDYYKAEQRLENALEAIKTFDLDLDETLRQLNESDLSDFDISLRMMQTNKHTEEKETIA